LVNLPAGASVTPNHMLGIVSAGSDRVQVTGRIVASGKDLVVLIDNSRQSLYQFSSPVTNIESPKKMLICPAKGTAFDVYEMFCHLSLVSGETTP